MSSITKLVSHAGLRHVLTHQPRSGGGAMVLSNDTKVIEMIEKCNTYMGMDYVFNHCHPRIKGSIVYVLEQWIMDNGFSFF